MQDNIHPGLVVGVALNIVRHGIPIGHGQLSLIAHDRDEGKKLAHVGFDLGIRKGERLPALHPFHDDNHILETAALSDIHFLEKPMPVTIRKGAAKHAIRVSAQLEFFGLRCSSLKRHRAPQHRPVSHDNCVIRGRWPKDSEPHAHLNNHAKTQAHYDRPFH